MPESPRWLLRHGRYDDVRKAMATLGAGDVSDEDIRSAAQVIEQVEGGNKQQRRAAWTPGVRRALVVVCLFFVFQQITGINIVALIIFSAFPGSAATVEGTKLRADPMFEVS